jgi:Ni/Fe-hydrogenase subunit HybB-like protein
MDVTFARIKGDSFEYRVMMLVFAMLALPGIIATFYIMSRGLWVTGMYYRVPWGSQIVMAVYYIGLSAGSLVISGLYGVFGKLEYKPFARLAVYLAMLFLIAGLLCILTDQGRMDRVFVQPFVHFNLRSMFSINPILYNGHILICIVYLWALFNEKKRLTKVVATLAFGWAFCVHSGTGAIFGYGARVLYESPLLPASFVAAAMASGTALMIIMIVSVFRLTHRHVDDELIVWLGRFLAITVLVVVYFLTVENIYRAYVIALRPAAMYFLFGGGHSLLFWIGLMLIGMFIPMIILFNHRTGKSVKYIVFASSLVIFGVLCERYVIDPSRRNPARLGDRPFTGRGGCGRILDQLPRGAAGAGCIWSDRISVRVGIEVSPTSSVGSKSTQTCGNHFLGRMQEWFPPDESRRFGS